MDEVTLEEILAHSEEEGDEQILERKLQNEPTRLSIEEVRIHMVLEETQKQEIAAENPEIKSKPYRSGRSRNSQSEISRETLRLEIIAEIQVNVLEEIARNFQASNKEAGCSINLMKGILEKLLKITHTELTLIEEVKEHKLLRKISREM